MMTTGYINMQEEEEKKEGDMPGWDKDLKQTLDIDYLNDTHKSGGVFLKCSHFAQRSASTRTWSRQPAMMK